MRIDIIKKGLDQIPTGNESFGIVKLKNHLEAGKPILLTGGVTRDEVGWPMVVALPAEDQQKMMNTYGNYTLCGFWNEIKGTKDFRSNLNQYGYYLGIGHFQPEDILRICESILEERDK